MANEDLVVPGQGPDAQAIRNAAFEEAALAMAPMLRDLISRGEAAATIRALKHQPAPEVQDALQAAQAEVRRLRRANFELESKLREQDAAAASAPRQSLADHTIGQRARDFAEWLNAWRDHDVSAVFHQILSKVCELLASTSWLPIDTAPRGGELVLLAGEMGGPGDWRIKVGGYWDGQWNLFGGSWKPTRWMPLPLPPGARPEDLVHWALTGVPAKAESSPPAPASSATLQCWNCSRTLTYDQRADADGQCPYCDAEIELDDGSQEVAAGAVEPAVVSAVAPATVDMSVGDWTPQQILEAIARPEYHFCHFWDYLDAKTASAATVTAKTRKGWKVFRVSQGFGAAGGTANYEHALVGPAGELFKVSTRTVTATDVPVEGPALPLNMKVLLLPGIVKTHLTAEASRRGLNRAEDLGARWNPELRSWMVRPEAAADFAMWIPAGAKPIHMLPSLAGK